MYNYGKDMVPLFPQDFVRASSLSKVWMAHGRFHLQEREKRGKRGLRQAFEPVARVRGARWFPVPSAQWWPHKSCLRTPKNYIIDLLNLIDIDMTSTIHTGHWRYNPSILGPSYWQAVGTAPCEGVLNFDISYFG